MIGIGTVAREQRPALLKLIAEAGELHAMGRSLDGPEFEVGDRCELSPIGRLRCFRYSSPTGTIVSAPKNHGWVRVRFDGSQNPKTLHKSYVIRLQPANLVEA